MINQWLFVIGIFSISLIVGTITLIIVTNIIVKRLTKIIRLHNIETESKILDPKHDIIPCINLFYNELKLQKKNIRYTKITDSEFINLTSYNNFCEPIKTFCIELQFDLGSIMRLREFYTWKFINYYLTKGTKINNCKIVEYQKIDPDEKLIVKIPF